MAKIDLQIDVEEVDASTYWRTRAIATTDRNGKLGFFKSRSHSIAPVTDCLICVEGMNFSEIASRDLKGDVRVEISSSNTGERSIALAPTRGEEKARLTEGPAVLHENVLGRTVEVSQESFWQSHKKSA